MTVKIEQVSEAGLNALIQKREELLAEVEILRIERDHERAEVLQLQTELTSACETIRDLNYACNEVRAATLEEAACVACVNEPDGRIAGLIRALKAARA